ncbi:MAG: hypothetical protein SGILL_010607, partial [Bacillariaceae sp.]
MAAANWMLKRASTGSSCTIESLELFLSRRLDGDELEYLTRHDAHYLKCATAVQPYVMATILGVIEDLDLNEDEEARIQRASELSVNMTFYQALSCKDSQAASAVESASPDDFMDCTKTQRGPHSEWMRQQHGQKSSPLHAKQDSSTANLWWVDLRSALAASDNGDCDVSTNTPLPTQESVVNLYRSLFTCAHDVSPWDNPIDDSSIDATPHRPDI